MWYRNKKGKKESGEKKNKQRWKGIRKKRKMKQKKIKKKFKKSIKKKEQRGILQKIRKSKIIIRDGKENQKRSRSKRKK